MRYVEARNGRAPEGQGDQENAVEIGCRDLGGFTFDRAVRYSLPEERLKALENVIGHQIHDIFHDIRLYIPPHQDNEEKTFLTRIEDDGEEGAL